MELTDVTELYTAQLEIKVDCLHSRHKQLNSLELECQVK